MLSFCASLGLFVTFLLGNEAPNLVALYALHGNVHDQTAHELFATVASENEDFHDRVLIDAGNPLRATNALLVFHVGEHLGPGSFQWPWIFQSTRSLRCKAGTTSEGLAP